MDRAERRPARRLVSRFLAKLASRGVLRRFARVELARRKLDEHATERIAELALDDEAPIRQHGHDQHRARVDDVLARRERAVRESHDVAADVQ